MPSSFIYSAPRDIRMLHLATKLISLASPVLEFSFFRTQKKKNRKEIDEKKN